MVTPSTHNRSAMTVAAALERRIAVEILRGERAPGSHLPPVRALAAEHGVTAPTIQRVVDRLEATGLVSVRRGSGVTVNDPNGCGELSLLPVWFDALSDQPDRMANMLADFLELRRVMAAHLIRTRAQRIARAAADLVGIAHPLQDSTDLATVIEADLGFTRAVIAASGQFAVTALFHTTEALVRDVPFVAEALYGDRAYHRRVIARIAAAMALRDGADAAAAEVERALAGWDRRTVDRFLSLCG